MNTLVSTQAALPFDRDTVASRLLSLARDVFTSRIAAITGTCGAIVHIRARPALITDAPAPDLHKIWGHTVKRAQQGSPIHRQTLALLDRDDRLAIEAVCGSWRG